MRTVTWPTDDNSELLPYITLVDEVPEETWFVNLSGSMGLIPISVIANANEVVRQTKKADGAKEPFPTARICLDQICWVSTDLTRILLEEYPLSNE